MGFLRDFKDFDGLVGAMRDQEICWEYFYYV